MMSVVPFTDSAVLPAVSVIVDPLGASNGTFWQAPIVNERPAKTAVTSRRRRGRANMKAVNILVPMKLAGQAQSQRGYAMAVASGRHEHHGHHAHGRDAGLETHRAARKRGGAGLPWDAVRPRDRAVPAQDGQCVPAEHRSAGARAVPAEEVQGPDHERRFRAVARGGRRRRRNAGPRQPAGRTRRTNAPAGRGSPPASTFGSNASSTPQARAGVEPRRRSARRARAPSEASAASPARARTNLFASTTAVLTTTSGRSSTSSSNRRPAWVRPLGERVPAAAAPRLPARAASAGEAVHPIVADQQGGPGVRTVPGPAALAPSRADSPRSDPDPAGAPEHASRPLLSLDVWTVPLADASARLPPLCPLSPSVSSFFIGGSARSLRRRVQK